MATEAGLIHIWSETTKAVFLVRRLNPLTLQSQRPYTFFLIAFTVADININTIDNGRGQ